MVIGPHVFYPIYFYSCLQYTFFSGVGQRSGYGRLCPPVGFPPMPDLYDKDGEDVLLDLVEYPVIFYPDPISFPSFSLQQLDSLRGRVCLKRIYLSPDTNPNSFGKGGEFFLNGRKDFDLIGFQFRGLGPFSPCPRG